MYLYSFLFRLMLIKYHYNESHKWMVNMKDKQVDEMNSRNRDTNKVLLSFVIPLFNEEESVDQLIEEIEGFSSNSKRSYEIVFVNDGSGDNTLNKIISAQVTRETIVLVNLSRNFGKEHALCAGLDYAKGGVVVIMDGDLQHPIALVEKMLEYWSEGYDTVYTSRVNREEEGVVKRTLTSFFYKIFNGITDIKIVPNASDFRLMDRVVVDALSSLRENNRFTKGLYSWVGFKAKEIPYIPNERLYGTSTWSLKHLLKFGLNGVFGFSSVPLRITSLLGVLFSFFGFIYGTNIIINVLIYGKDVPGYASIIATIVFFGGVQLLSLGVIGEYIARIFDESKQRPLYIVEGCYKNGSRADTKS